MSSSTAQGTEITKKMNKKTKLKKVPLDFFFLNLDKLNLKFIWKNISKAIWENTYTVSSERQEMKYSL